VDVRVKLQALIPAVGLSAQQRKYAVHYRGDNRYLCDLLFLPDQAYSVLKGLLHQQQLPVPKRELLPRYRISACLSGCRYAVVSECPVWIGYLTGIERT
jgi:hypothetical protein